MKAYIKYDYFGYLMYNMAMKIEDEYLVEYTTMGKRKFYKGDLNDIGLFNFKYIIDRDKI